MGEIQRAGVIGAGVFGGHAFGVVGIGGFGRGGALGIRYGSGCRGQQEE